MLNSPKLILQSTVILLAGLFSTTITRADDVDIALLRTNTYVSQYFNNTTNLAYGSRVNGGVAGLPSIADVNDNLPSPPGYGTGLADVAYHTGTFLFSAVEAYEGTGEQAFADLARRSLSGLFLMDQQSVISPGFVIRGPHPSDLTVYYRDSSIDQHTLYLAGLWRFYHSSLATTNDKSTIENIVAKVVNRIKANNWSIVTESGGPATAGGSQLSRTDPTRVAALLSIAAMGYDITGSSLLRADYENFITEYGGQRLNTLANDDPSQHNSFNLFENQDVFRTEILSRIESDPVRKAIYEERVTRMAAAMLSAPALSSFSSSYSAYRDETIEDNIELLERFGVEVDADATVSELMGEFTNNNLNQGPSSERVRFAELTLMFPMMVAQAAFLSGDEQSIELIKPLVLQAAGMNLNNVSNSWGHNYSTVAVNLAVAPEPAVGGLFLGVSLLSLAGRRQSVQRG